MVSLYYHLNNIAVSKLQDENMHKSSILDIPDELSRIKPNPDRFPTISDDEEVIFVGTDMRNTLSIDKSSEEFIINGAPVRIVDSRMKVETVRKSLVKVKNSNIDSHNRESSSLISAYSLNDS
jgi:hypothetical protein